MGKKILKKQSIQWYRLILFVLCLIGELAGKFIWNRVELSSGEIVIEKTNYLSPIVFQNGNWGPLLTFFCTALMCLLMIWQLMQYHRYRSMNLNLKVSYFLSLCAVAFNILGIYITGSAGVNPGVIILEVLLVIQFVLLFVQHHIAP